MPGTTRFPIVAGSFYPASPEILREQLRGWLGDVPHDGDALLAGPAGLIAPHAGIMYSGHVAAMGYASVVRQGRPARVVLLGASHSGRGPTLAMTPHAAWQTPLGDSPVDEDATAHLRSHGFAIDEVAFLREHSLELQLPFIQYLWGCNLPILPICVKPDDRERLLAAGRALAEWIGTSSTLVVASSDFTHYEPADRAAEADEAAFQAIARLDARTFLEAWVAEDWTLCGAGAIAVLLEMAKTLRWTRAARVAYATSGDVTGDRSSVVGYAAITFS